MGRPLRVVLLVVAVLVGVAVLWTGWSLWQARDSLVSAREEAARLRTAIEVGDQRQADASLAVLREHAEDARSRTDGPVVAVLSLLPVLGDDLAGVALASEATHQVAERGLPPLVKASADVSAGTFLPQDGRVPVDRVAALQGPLAESADAFADARETLADGDADAYAGPLASAYDSLVAQVGDGAEALSVAHTASELIPSMLGAEGKRTYVTLFQNNAEIRSLGGIPGATALLTADGGRLDLGRQLPALPASPEPVLELTGEERALHDEQPATYYQDLTLLPHFPRVAELAAAHWRARFGQESDGVVSIDPVALSYLLEGTGPVTVSGVELTSDNAVDVLLRDTYQRLEPAEQDVFFAEAASAIFDRMTAGDGDSRALLRAMVRGVEEGRILLTSFDDAEQDRLTGTRIAGEVAGPDDRSQLGVYLNDATRSKLSYYLDHELTDLTCDREEGVLTGTLELRSSVPEGGEGLTDYQLGDNGGIAPPGDMLVVVELHAPPGASVVEVSEGGQAHQLDPLRLGDHEVVQTFTTVPAQGSSRLELRVEGAALRDPVDVRVTPGVRGHQDPGPTCAP